MHLISCIHSYRFLASCNCGRKNNNLKVGYLVSTEEKGCLWLNAYLLLISKKYSLAEESELES